LTLSRIIARLAEVLPQAPASVAQHAHHWQKVLQPTYDATQKSFRDLGRRSPSSACRLCRTAQDIFAGLMFTGNVCFDWRQLALHTVRPDRTRKTCSFITIASVMRSCTCSTTTLYAMQNRTATGSQCYRLQTLMTRKIRTFSSIAPATAMTSSINKHQVERHASDHGITRDWTLVSTGNHLIYAAQYHALLTYGGRHSDQNVSYVTEEVQYKSYF
jgi:hypothetical protein